MAIKVNTRDKVVLDLILIATKEYEKAEKKGDDDTNYARIKYSGMLQFALIYAQRNNLYQLAYVVVQLMEDFMKENE